MFWNPYNILTPQFLDFFISCFLTPPVRCVQAKVTPSVSRVRGVPATSMSLLLKPLHMPLSRNCGEVAHPAAATIAFGAVETGREKEREEVSVAGRSRYRGFTWRGRFSESDTNAISQYSQRWKKMVAAASRENIEVYRVTSMQNP